MTQSEATLTATFDEVSGGTVTRAGFLYGTSESNLDKTAYSNSTPTSVSGSFEAGVTGLVNGTKYYYKAWMQVGDTDFYGDVKTFSTGAGANAPADYGWFELPAQTDRDKDGIDDVNPDLYYSHTFRPDVTNSRVRNFSCGYSKSKVHPVWVAAPMHSCYLGNSGRNDSYKSDPNIKCTQSSSYDGYTRGHMIASSDRTVSVATNKQVFYYSNIGAQLQSGFNTGGGAWNYIESRVDGYVCADTLYQVVGCIFDDFTDAYGSTVKAKTGKNGGSQTFQVPTAYYKVLLRTKKGNSGKRVDKCTADELQCVAFVVAHRSNQGHKASSQDLYSVEEVEKMTGLTFFVNVPNAPKSSYNASDWGF